MKKSHIQEMPTRGRPRWTEEEILESLKKLTAELGRAPKTAEVTACNYCPDNSTIKYRFGSLNKALERIEIPVTCRQWHDEKELLRVLLRLTDELGRIPSPTEINDCNYCPCYQTYTKKFGSYDEALRLVGLVRNRKSNWTDEELLERLKRLANELGRTPSCTDIDSCDYCPSSNLYYGRFGGVTNAMLQIGATPNEQRNARLWSEAEILGALKRFADELGRIPTMKEVDDCDYCPSSCTCIKKFGSWKKALNAAQLDFAGQPRWTRDAMLRALDRLTAEIGRIPTQREVTACSYCPSASAYCRRFGSWDVVVNLVK